MKEIKEVNWRRTYPYVLENENLYLIRKNWGFRLIYEVYLKNSWENKFLGTCHVMQSFEKNESKLIVKEDNVVLKEMEKRKEEIQQLIWKNISV